MYSTADLLFSRCFTAIRDLKIAMAEGGIGWVPYILERADYVWNRHRFYQNVDQRTLHQNFFAEHMFGCFIDDVHASVPATRSASRASCGEADYPHSDSNWPNSRKACHRGLRRHPDAEVRQMVETIAVSCSTFRADVRPMSSNPTRRAEGDQ